MDKQSALKELRRELAMRESVYPSWVAQGKLSQKTADYRVECMQEAIVLIESLPDDEQQAQGQLGLFGGVA